MWYGLIFWRVWSFGILFIHNTLTGKQVAGTWRSIKKKELTDHWGLLTFLLRNRSNDDSRLDLPDVYDRIGTSRFGFAPLAVKGPVCPYGAVPMTQQKFTIVEPVARSVKTLTLVMILNWLLRGESFLRSW